MFNRPNVTLVDIRSAPIESVYPGGVKTSAESYDLDALVFATGFDALTGALLAMDIRGAGGVAARSAWAAGPRAYLGVAAAGFPNMFIDHRARVARRCSPTWCCPSSSTWSGCGTASSGCGRRGATTIEPTAAAAGRVDGARDRGGERDAVPKADSWYVGANIPGKPRVFTSYVGGVRAVPGQVRRGGGGRV